MRVGRERAGGVGDEARGELESRTTDEIANLKVALEACEKKWYNKGFVDAENSVQPVIHKAQRLAFGEGWLASLQAMGDPEDSPLRNPDQTPFPDYAPFIQNPPNADEEEETASMRDLVRQIDSYVELVDLEVTNNLHDGDHLEGTQTQPPTTAQPSEVIPDQPTRDTAFSPTNDPAI